MKLDLRVKTLLTFVCFQPFISLKASAEPITINCEYYGRGNNILGVV
jgi:hypothetical protein